LFFKNVSIDISINVAAILLDSGLLSSRVRKKIES
jgi:hypothetical protein